jgi:hypothetical protein
MEMKKDQLWRVVRRGGKDGMFFKKILHTGFFISWCGECDIFILRLSLVNDC